MRKASKIWRIWLGIKSSINSPELAQINNSEERRVNNCRREVASLVALSSAKTHPQSRKPKKKRPSAKRKNSWKASSWWLRKIARLRCRSVGLKSLWPGRVESSKEPSTKNSTSSEISSKWLMMKEQLVRSKKVTRLLSSSSSSKTSTWSVQSPLSTGVLRKQNCSLSATVSVASSDTTNPMVLSTSSLSVSRIELSTRWRVRMRLRKLCLVLSSPTLSSVPHSQVTSSNGIFVLNRRQFRRVSSPKMATLTQFIH